VPRGLAEHHRRRVAQTAEAVEEAKQFLIEILTAGEVPAKEVKVAVDDQAPVGRTGRRGRFASRQDGREATRHRHCQDTPDPLSNVR
jgi:hypothetical protein